MPCLVERASYLRRLKRLMLKRREEIATLVAREQGKPRIEALIVELFPPLDVSAFLIDDGVRLLRPRPIRSKILSSATAAALIIFTPTGCGL